MSIAVRMSAVLFVVVMVLTLILSPLVTGTARGSDCANTIYVDASRPDDSGNGLTWATAKKYIQSGISRACHGGTVYVAAGIYNQPATGELYEVVWLDDDLTIIGAGAPNTIIDGMDTYRGISITSHPGQINSIRGFTIRNGRGPNYHVKALHSTLRGAGVGIHFPDGRQALFDGSRNLPDGGGIFITDQHTVTIEDCEIINNKGQNGGGIYNSGQLTMRRCTVANNWAYSEGGGIYMYWTGPPAATLDLTNCTINGNRSDIGYGGGIHSATEMRLLNCTVSGNRVTDAMGQGGGFANLSGNTAYFKNCIVANNTVPVSGNNNGYSDNPNGVVSEGYNIDSENTCYFIQATDQRNTDPLLGPLQNNGGPTSTCAITLISPAFNRGTASGAPATDQRGITRPQAGAYDIGAYELLVVPTVISCEPGSGLQGQCPLTVIITGSNLDGATEVSFGDGVTVNSFTVNGSTQITADICIGGATPGAHDVSVTAPGGTGTLPGGFLVVQQNQLIGSGSSPTSGTGNGPTQPVPLPTVAVQSATLSTTSVAPGMPVTVTADITNKGAVNGIKKVTLYVNGQVESTQGVTVNSGSSLELTFNVARSEPGDYSVYVDGVPAGSFKVEMVAGNDSILIYSSILIALAFVFGIVMLWRRQRTG